MSENILDRVRRDPKWAAGKIAALTARVEELEGANEGLKFLNGELSADKEAAEAKLAAVEDWMAQRHHELGYRVWQSLASILAAKEGE